MQANFHTADTLSCDGLYENPLVLGPCKLNVPVATGSKAVHLLFARIGCHALPFTRTSFRKSFLLFSSFSKSSKLVKVLPTYNESSSGTDSLVAAMLTKTEEATDSWTESKKREKILSKRLVC